MGLVLGAELPGRFQVSLPRAVMLDKSVEDASRSGRRPRPLWTKLRRAISSTRRRSRPPARLSARTLLTSAALTIHIVLATFPFVRAPSTTSSRIWSPWWMSGACGPLTAQFSCGYSVLIPSIAGEQPKLCRPAGGNPSNWWLRSQGRHCDGNATAPPDSAAVPVIFRDRHVLATRVRLCGCAGRSYLSQSTSQLHEIMGARRTKQTRRFHPASSWHQSRTGMILLCEPKYRPELAHSDGNRASRRSLATRAQSGLCRPICAGCAACKLHARCAMHARCMYGAGGCWIAPGKPPPAAYVCGTMLTVRIRSRLRSPLAAHDDSLSNTCVCAELGGQVRSWATQRPLCARVASERLDARLPSECASSARYLLRARQAHTSTRLVPA